jgi:hypothetical protein
MKVVFFRKYDASILFEKKKRQSTNVKYPFLAVEVALGRPPLEWGQVALGRPPLEWGLQTRPQIGLQ